MAHIKGVSTMFKFTDQEGCTQYSGKAFLYDLPVDGLAGGWNSAPYRAEKDAQACGPGRLHLMHQVWPIYAPSYYRCFEAKGKGLIGKDNEKSAYFQVQLLRELSAQEIDDGIEKEWIKRLKKPGLYSAISWVRTARFLDRPVNQNDLLSKLQAISKMLNKSGEVKFVGASLRASLWASLRASLWDSLRASLRDSLIYERGFELVGKPKPELGGLLDVWKAGACPMGFDKDGTFLVLIKE